MELKNIQPTNQQWQSALRCKSELQSVGVPAIAVLEGQAARCLVKHTAVKTEGQVRRVIQHGLDWVPASQCFERRWP